MLLRCFANLPFLAANEAMILNKNAFFQKKNCSPKRVGLFFALYKIMCLISLNMSEMNNDVFNFINSLKPDFKKINFD